MEIAQQLLIVVIFTILFTVVLRKPKKSNVKTASPPLPPPGPRGLPIIGNLHEFDPKNPHLYLTKLAKQYGPVVSLRLGSIPVVVISSADAAKQALKTHDRLFSGRPEVIGQQRLSYSGRDIVFSQYNDHWREMRKTCNTHLFSVGCVRSLRPIRAEEVSVMIGRVSAMASSSELVDVSEVAMSTAVDFICRSAFGRKYVGEERIKFDEVFHRAQALLVHFFVSDLFPGLGWVDKLLGMTDELERIFGEADDFARELVEEHLSPDRRLKSMEGDIIDVLLQLHKQQSSTHHERLTLDHIKAVLLDILVAGTETIATTVVWAMTNLMMKPLIMKKAQDEISQLIEKKDSIIDEESIQKLPYLKAIIKETLRLYPPTPLLQPRETTEKCTIEGFEIQAKSFVIVNAWAIGRDPKYWERSEEFMPERFLDCAVDYKGQDFELIPFGAGRRICPGLNMGIASVEVILVNLLHSFEWEMPPGVKWEEIDTEVLPGITMQKKNPLRLLAKHANHHR